ncbi:MAG TPA: UbiA prenyltransferase family protein [Candidatus Fimihabitans intestinipullorum]|uniref:UbiA prenyltransferase family protein n=1 Tax=Candidatus Fimihabitans intestinipullorum TaxID=2840820 RepID=A0A9D1L3V9_9BACT|nr:UbiA prenyltransferase family protein [Candidatus Fimihabitans intestinipullorum]
MKQYLKLIRVKHWLKNGLVFLPLFFSMNLCNIQYLSLCFLAFVIFSLSSSVVYVLNDMADVEKDKLHPIKKNRPLASGAISMAQAKIVIVILCILIAFMMGLLYWNDPNFFIILIPIVYIILNLLYSKWLKHISIIDVVILVSGFVLRVMYGGVVVDVVVSKYLYLMIIFGSFYLGFGKRRNEMIKNGKKSRKVLEAYNQAFLDKNMYVCLALAIVSYSLWCVDPMTIARTGHDYLFWTIPILMVILQLYSLNIEGSSHGDPIEVVLSDKRLLVVIVLYIFVMTGLLYLI